MGKNLEGVTCFQRRVYDACRRIPRGKVTTYQYLASSIGCRSSRAVGQALRRNPFAPRVPCHRVISSDLTIGGFAGHAKGKEIRRKLALLKAEGVKFVDGRLADKARIECLSDAGGLLGSERLPHIPKT